VVESDNLVVIDFMDHTNPTHRCNDDAFARRNEPPKRIACTYSATALLEVQQVLVTQAAATLMGLGNPRAAAQPPHQQRVFI
jgi:hypothetical protein